MPRYSVAPTHDLTLPFLTEIEPEPSGDPVAPVERNYSASGRARNQGGFLKLHWDHVDDPAAYLALLAQFGLDSVDNQEVTVYARNERFIWTLYNGMATVPEPTVDMKWQQFFPRDIDIYITELEDIS